MGFLPKFGASYPRPMKPFGAVSEGIFNQMLLNYRRASKPPQLTLCERFPSVPQNLLKNTSSAMLKMQISIHLIDKIKPLTRVKTFFLRTHGFGDENCESEADFELRFFFFFF